MTFQDLSMDPHKKAPLELQQLSCEKDGSRRHDWLAGSMNNKLLVRSNTLGQRCSRLVTEV